MEAITIASIWAQSVSLIFKQDSQFFSIPSLFEPIKKTFTFFSLFSLSDFDFGHYFDRYTYYVNFGFRIGFIFTNLLLPLLLCFVTLILFKPLNVVLCFVSLLLFIFALVCFTYLLAVQYVSFFNIRLKSILTIHSIGLHDWHFLIISIVFLLITLLILIISLINYKFNIWKKIPSLGIVINKIYQKIKSLIFNSNKNINYSQEDEVRKVNVKPRLISSDSFASNKNLLLKEKVETIKQDNKNKGISVVEVKNIYEDFEVVVYKEHLINELKRKKEKELELQASKFIVSYFYVSILLVIGILLIVLLKEYIGGGIIILIGIIWILFFTPFMLFKKGRSLIFFFRHQIIEKYGVFIGLVALQVLYTPFLSSVFSSFVCVSKTCPQGSRFVTVNNGFSLDSLYMRSKTEFCEVCQLYNQTIGFNVNLNSTGASSICPVASDLCPGVTGLRLYSEPALDCYLDIMPYFWPASLLIGILYSIVLPFVFFLIVNRSVYILKKMDVHKLLWRNLPSHIRQEAKQLKLSNYLNPKRIIDRFNNYIKKKFLKKGKSKSMVGVWAPESLIKSGSLSLLIKSPSISNLKKSSLSTHGGISNQKRKKKTRRKRSLSNASQSSHTSSHSSHTSQASNNHSVKSKISSDSKKDRKKNTIDINSLTIKEKTNKIEFKYNIKNEPDVVDIKNHIHSSPTPNRKINQGRKRSHSISNKKNRQIITPLGIWEPSKLDVENNKLPNYSIANRKKVKKSVDSNQFEPLVTPSGITLVKKQPKKRNFWNNLLFKIFIFFWGWKRDEKSEVWLIRTNLSSNPSRAIYYSYEFRSRYFKILILLYKLFLVGISICLFNQPIISFSIVAALHFIFFILLILTRPYIFSLESILHIAATIICFINTIYALIISLADIPDYIAYPIIVINVLLLIAVIFILFLSCIVRLQFTWKYQTLFNKTRKFQKHISHIGTIEDRLADKYANVNYILTKRNLNIVVNFFILTGFISILSLFFCMISVIRHEFISDGFPSLQRSNAFTSSIKCSDRATLQFAGYSSWEEFTSSCCCSKSSFYKSSIYSNKFVNVEFWHCLNGERKERIREERVFDELLNGYSFRGFCEKNFTASYSVNSCGQLLSNGNLISNPSYQENYLW